MKYIATLENVEVDVNGGEYTEYIPVPIYLGLLDVENESQAQIDAQILADNVFNNWKHSGLLGYPSVVLTQI